MRPGMCVTEPIQYPAIVPVHTLVAAVVPFIYISGWLDERKVFH